MSVGTGDPLNGDAKVRAKLRGMPRPEDSPLYELVQERLRNADPVMRARMQGLKPDDVRRLDAIDPVDWVLARRREGLSWDKIALRLYNETGQRRMVTAQTLQNWAEGEEQPTPS